MQVHTQVQLVHLAKPEIQLIGIIKKLSEEKKSRSREREVPYLHMGCNCS